MDAKSFIDGHLKKGTMKSSLPRKKKAGKGKIQKVMHEYKHGSLHSGSKTGPKVTDRKQAIAIAMSEARRAKS